MTTFNSWASISKHVDEFGIISYLNEMLDWNNDKNTTNNLLSNFDLDFINDISGVAIIEKNKEASEWLKKVRYELVENFDGEGHNYESLRELHFEFEILKYGRLIW